MFHAIFTQEALTFFSDDDEAISTFFWDLTRETIRNCSASQKKEKSLL
jgi:hypothetical protein